ncbi:MAG: DUF1800 family protein [Chthoniobacterales bacterium]
MPGAELQVARHVAAARAGDGWRAPLDGPDALFAPPDVKGWDGGKSWISTGTLLFRYNFANYLLNGTGRRNNAPDALRRNPIDLTQIAPEDQRTNPEALSRRLARRLYQAPLGPKQTATMLASLKSQDKKPSDDTLRHVLDLMMST